MPLQVQRERIVSLPRRFSNQTARTLGYNTEMCVGVFSERRCKYGGNVLLLLFNSSLRMSFDVYESTEVRIPARATNGR